jgi:hypothetical protein
MTVGSPWIVTGQPGPGQEARAEDGEGFAPALVLAFLWVGLSRAPARASLVACHWRVAGRLPRSYTPEIQ